MPKLVIGQKLWYVPSYRSRYGVPEEACVIKAGIKEVCVIKVGRKWAYTNHHQRIDCNTLIVDGGRYSSPGRCYADRFEYERLAAIRSAWFEFRLSITNKKNFPDGVTLDDIENARKLLKL